MSRISHKTLINILPEEPPYHVGMLLNRLHTHFCNPLTYRDLCRKCEDCAENINQILEKASFGNGGYGALVWAIREVVAEIEESRPEAVALTDWLGEEIEGNIFERLV